MRFSVLKREERGIRRGREREGVRQRQREKGNCVRLWIQRNKTCQKSFFLNVLTLTKDNQRDGEGHLLL